MTEIIERGDLDALRRALEDEGFGASIQSRRPDEYTIPEVAEVLGCCYQTARRRMEILYKQGKWERRQVWAKGGEVWLYRKVTA